MVMVNVPNDPCFAAQIKYEFSGLWIQKKIMSWGNFN